MRITKGTEYRISDTSKYKLEMWDVLKATDSIHPYDKNGFISEDLDEWIIIHLSIDAATKTRNMR